MTNDELDNLLREKLTLLFNSKPEIFKQLTAASSAMRDAKRAIVSALQQDSDLQTLTLSDDADQTKAGGMYIVWCEPHGYVDLVPGLLLGDTLQAHSETQGPHNMRTEAFRVNVPPI